MVKYKSLALVACGVALFSAASAVYVTVDRNNNISDQIVDSVEKSQYNTGKLYTVSATSSVPTDFTQAAESTINGVVSIKSYATPRSYRSQRRIDPFFDFFFGPSERSYNREEKEPEQQQIGLGSGVIISQDGYIVTNNHVIDGAERLEVTLNDNSNYNATVVGTDASTDLALIKIDAENLPVIPIGDSDELKVGEWVLAVGNPFGFTSTVTSGIVSAKARNISAITNGRPMGIESYIQTDAAVNQGNSGGALVNTRGELVGINTAIVSNTGNYAGCSFAIPSSIVTKIVTDIKQYGAVQRAILGIAYSELTSKLAKENSITIVNDGIYIARVEDRSAAMGAGLQEGDVIISINNAPTHNTAQLQEQMNRYRPGDEITITYVRDNKKHNVTLTLRNSQGNTSITKANNMLDLGCAFKSVPMETLRQLEIRNGVQVTGLKDGKFSKAGIKNEFIILEINGKRINSQDDVKAVYDSIMKGNGYDKVMFITGIYPTGKKEYYAVDLAE